MAEEDPTERVRKGQAELPRNDGGYYRYGYFAVFQCAVVAAEPRKGPEKLSEYRNALPDCQGTFRTWESDQERIAAARTTAAERRPVDQSESVEPGYEPVETEIVPRIQRKRATGAGAARFDSRTRAECKRGGRSLLCQFFFRTQSGTFRVVRRTVRRRSQGEPGAFGHAQRPVRTDSAE